MTQITINRFNEIYRILARLVTEDLQYRFVHMAVKSVKDSSRSCCLAKNQNGLGTLFLYQPEAWAAMLQRLAAQAVDPTLTMNPDIAIPLSVYDVLDRLAGDLWFQAIINVTDTQQLWAHVLSVYCNLYEQGREIEQYNGGSTLLRTETKVVSLSDIDYLRRNKIPLLMILLEQLPYTDLGSIPKFLQTSA